MIQTVLLVQTFLVMTALTFLSVYAEPSIEGEDSETIPPSVIKWSKDREHINGTLSSSYLNDKQNEMNMRDKDVMWNAWNHAMRGMQHACGRDGCA